jgi:hypothetical protein
LISKIPSTEKERAPQLQKGLLDGVAVIVGTLAEIVGGTTIVEAARPTWKARATTGAVRFARARSIPTAADTSTRSSTFRSRSICAVRAGTWLRDSGVLKIGVHEVEDNGVLCAMLGKPLRGKAAAFCTRARTIAEAVAQL